MEQPQIRENISLQPYNTFGLNVSARFFARFSTKEQLKRLLGYNVAGTNNIMILGGGSNVLFTKDFNGLVLKNELDEISVKDEGEVVFVTAGGGVNWHQFVLYCLDRNYAGIENLALIPGSVGASPMQNIGAYGVEIKDVFHQLQAFHIKDKVLHTFSAEQCRFGYRESVFKNELKGQYVITSVTFRLIKTPKFNTSYGAIQQELEGMGIEQLSIQAVAQAVMNIRRSKLPDWKEIGNAGSFFKNPQVLNEKYLLLKKAYPAIVGYPQGDGIKLAAGWLIEQCGWKGFRRGDAGCYTKQALVLVNYGQASGNEIYSLSEEIISSVQQKFDVTLQREVNIV